MGFIPPPPPISEAEFIARHRAGARTLKELDPRLYAWLEANRRMRMIQAVVIIIGVLGILVPFGVAMLAALT